MAQVDFSRREITIKLVYYGPALSGKTTNLQALHARLTDAHRSRLLTLETANDRTLFFDLLPIALPHSSGPKVVLKLMTVPGQVMHNNTRRLVLRGADGVAFVADSRISETRANNEAYAHLRANLRDNGLDPDAIPIVIQFNKRDLPAELIRSEQELAQIARRGRERIITASALRGEGVVETFFALAALVWDALERQLGLGSRHGIDKAFLLRELGRRLNASAEADKACEVGDPCLTPTGQGGS
ncbi:MAG: GTPase domain-containing protein [Myxococcales bacterium]|nr:GTPase domain-containing protein [Myxococcota bacterium]MDW8284275.1 GTPase domain-containing protein [Myxococcales bacterium]